MSIDICPVSGFSVDLPEELLFSLFKKHRVEHEDDLFPELDLDCETVGCSFTGDTKTILLFEPDGCVDLDGQLRGWLIDVNTKLGTSFKPEDVVFVSDFYRF